MREYMHNLYYDMLKPPDRQHHVYHLVLNEAGQKRYENIGCSMSLYRFRPSFRRFLVKYGIWSPR